MPLPTAVRHGMVNGIPVPPPGQTLPTNIGFLQLVRDPFDVLFFQNWPEEITEGLTTEWDEWKISLSPQPLDYFYGGSVWDDLIVNLDFHSAVPQAGFGLTDNTQQSNLNVGGFPIGNPFENPIINLLRIQMQVAWCKSLALPDLTAVKDAKERTRLSGTGTAGGAAQLFPPRVRIVYGGFFIALGYALSVKVRYLPPFTPIVGFPHRATVEIAFKRIFADIVDFSTVRLKNGLGGSGLKIGKLTL